MAAGTPAPEAPSKSGSGLKIVLIAVIVILSVGVGVAWILLKPETQPVLESFTWPPEGGEHGVEDPLKLTATLQDGSYHLLADIRLRTAPVDLKSQGSRIIEDFNSHKSVILSTLTDVANSLDQTTVHKTREFKTRVLRKLNEEFQSTEIEDVLIENWLVQPVE